MTRAGFGLTRLPFLRHGALTLLRRDGVSPRAELDRLRREHPIKRLWLPFFPANVWLITGYDAVRAVLADRQGFSTDFDVLARTAGIPGARNPGGLGFSDPPAHTRIRRLLTPEFTKRRLDRLRPHIETIVRDVLDAMPGSDHPVDLVSSFARPIPSLVICELLGVPHADRADFQRLSTARFDMAAGVRAPLSSMSEAVTHLRGVVREQRAAPGDGLLGMIIRQHGDRIDEDELAELVDGLLTGGFETTASMLALGTVVLRQDPVAWRLVGDHDLAAPDLVEELLRYLTVVQVAFPRVARRDLQLTDTLIARGDIVICSLSAANRDDSLGPRIDQFLPARPASPHMAFGHGIHHCIGAELARMELRAAFPALVRRFPNMRLAIDPSSLRYRKRSIVYGIESLPVILGENS